ncbi:28S ribosomal protein S27, mitochondrial [Harpegnathos saltator]|uniref:28S ribosomal protein S27, mitochondrial n=1 Tax=Harpegnathos saltator TaxID=610380 RepID=E2BUK8_HARSA|nr:28S ribosomal protein S27, mitochondrial [Harpegnathos saltator]XP_011145374.1 28S ribosomal protein S27, mitochondrial [Harpegnathos saltator]EFN80617.1 28S ribosomal protein S27, mitochondrial [Harpegnathos saltator]
MLRILALSRKLCRNCRGFKNVIAQRRTFLSEAYRCNEAWNRRLESPLLQEVNHSAMLIMLEQKFASVGKVSAVDIDIFVNSVSDDTYVNEVLKILHNLRMSPEATNILESTHHAVIRYLWQHNFIEELHEIVNDRINYGIFPDYFCYNFLMDDFIKKQDYASAAKIATLVMLQEETENPITNALCVYACHKYLENPEEWKKPEVPVDTSKEEIKVGVEFIRNPFFDDHFDLTDPKDLVGKTLSFHGKHQANVLGRTCQLRGLMLYKKYNQVLHLIKEWMETIQDKIVYDEVFELITKDNSESQDQSSEELKLVEDQLSILKVKQNDKGNLVEAIENAIRSAVTKTADKDVSKLYQAYLDWEQVRTSILEDQIKAIETQKKIANMEKIKKNLEEREQLLTFFDNEEQIELKIEEIEELNRKEDKRIRAMHGSEKKLRKLIAIEAYIPPDVKNKK